MALPGNLIEWFGREATMLEGIMRALAGKDAVDQYLRQEQVWRLGSDLQRVEKRSQAIERMLLR